VKTDDENENEVVKDLALSGDQCKESYRNYEAIDYKAQDCKSKTQKNAGNLGNSQNGA
jgi:hypothetical protein